MASLVSVWRTGGDQMAPVFTQTSIRSLALCELHSPPVVPRFFWKDPPEAHHSPPAGFSSQADTSVNEAVIMALHVAGKASLSARILFLVLEILCPWIHFTHKSEVPFQHGMLQERVHSMLSVWIPYATWNLTSPVCAVFLPHLSCFVVIISGIVTNWATLISAGRTRDETNLLIHLNAGCSITNFLKDGKAKGKGLGCLSRGSSRMCFSFFPVH